MRIPKYLLVAALVAAAAALVRAVRDLGTPGLVIVAQLVTPAVMLVGFMLVLNPVHFTDPAVARLCPSLSTRTKVAIFGLSAMILVLGGSAITGFGWTSAK